jgi:UDP-glucuronate decarboxylase
MVDGPGNSVDLINQYIAKGEGILKNDNAKVLVVCDHGQSRSNFIAAHLYMRLHQTSWNAAIDTVMRRHPDSKMQPCFMGELPRQSSTISRVAISGGSGMLAKAASTVMANLGLQCKLLSRSREGDYLANSDDVRAAIDGFQPDIFLHLAHPKPFNSEATTQVAMAQLASVVWYCEKNAVRLLFPSSWVVFDGSTLDTVTCTSQVCTHTRYGRLKVACEAYLAECMRQGLNAKVARLPGVFGMETLDPRFLRYFAGCVRANENIVVHRFNNGYARVPLMAIEDAASLLAKLIIDFDQLDRLLHMGPIEQTPSVKEIASHVAERFDLKISENVVDRHAFCGEFVPDRNAHSAPPSAAKIFDFISQLV